MKKKILVFCCMMCTAALLTGCGADKEAPAKDQLVKTTTVSVGTTVADGVYSGTVRGRYETNLGFQVGGRILNRYVQLGDKVNAGDVLMSIDSRDVVEQSNQVDAKVAAAEAQLNLARTNLSRYSQLYEQSAVSAAVLDQYQTSYDAAVASYDQAIAAAKQGHNAVGYTNLVAGTSGVISAVNAEAGQVVAAGQSVLTLVQESELEVEINVPENHLADVPIGKTVEVNFWALGSASVQGVVREVAPMADATTRTYKVRVSIANPPAGMQLGMTASVKCSEAAKGSSKSAVLPLSAIYQTGDTPMVWVVDKNTMTLSLKKVTINNYDNNQVNVSGVSSGDTIVTAGVHKLREGEKVRLMEDTK